MKLWHVDITAGRVHFRSLREAQVYYKITARIGEPVTMPAYAGDIINDMVGDLLLSRITPIRRVT